jgi:hypothetical protein
MAINNDIKDQSNAGMAGAQAAPQQQQTAFSAGAGAAAKRGNFITNVLAMSGNYVAQHSGGEYFNKMREIIEKSTGECLMEGLVGRTYGLNSKEYSTKFSVIAISVALETHPNLVAYHTLLLEATGEKLQPENIQMNGRNIFVRRVTGDAVDSRVITNVHEVVSRVNGQAEILNAGAQVIPSFVKIDDKDTIEAIVRNAAMACVSQIQRYTQSYEVICLADVPRDMRMELNVVTSNSTSYDELGNPVRSSAVLTTNFVTPNARRDNRQMLDIVNVEDNSLKFAEVTGFLNPIWYPGDMSGVMYHTPQQQQAARPKLAAEFVVTGIRTPAANSPAAVLLALASSYAMADDNKWIQLLFPVGQRPEEDKTRDIGNLNIICDIFNEKQNGIFGSPASVASMNGDPFKISQYLSSCFVPGMVLSLDCLEAGTSSWYTNLFVAAGAGDQDAINTIIASCDELTDGHFSTLYNRADPIISNMIRVPVGHYLVDGKKRDIRDVDLTYIAGVFATNPAQIHEYNSTFVLRQGFDEPTLLAQREGFIAHALRDQLEITAYARRCSLGGKFLQAFSAAIAATHVNTVVQTPLSVEQFRQGTPAADFISQALVTGTHTFNSMGGGAPRLMFGNMANMGISNFRR